MAMETGGAKPNDRIFTPAPNSFILFHPRPTMTSKTYLPLPCLINFYSVLICPTIVIYIFFNKTHFINVNIL